jgi:hypothetical protein
MQKNSKKFVEANITIYKADEHKDSVEKFNINNEKIGDVLFFKEHVGEFGDDGTEALINFRLFVKEELFNYIYANIVSRNKISNISLDVDEDDDDDNSNNENERQSKQEAGTIICQYMSENPLHRNKIGITGGELRIYEKREYSPLTFQYIEECLGDIIPNKDDVHTIIQHIKTKRTVRTSQDIQLREEKPSKPV